MKRFTSRAVNHAGSLISAANISVYRAGTSTLMSLFSGEGLTALANPFKSDHLGVFEFYTEGADLDIEISDPVTGFGRRFFDISHFDPRDLNVLKSGDTMQGILRLQSGTVSNPGLGFGADTDTGLYRVGADEIGIAAGAADAARLRSDGVTLRAPLTAVTPSLNGSYAASIDQSGNRIWFYVKKSGGTLHSGSVSLSA